MVGYLHKAKLYCIACSDGLAKRNQRRTFLGMSSVFRAIKNFSLAMIAAISLAIGQMAADETKPVKPEAKLGTLIIEFDGLANDKGEVLAGLYNEAKKFPKENQALRNLKGKPANKKCIIKTDKLPFGDYALAVMHDKNKSGDMDYILFKVPTERYGFSNNKRPAKFAPPNFEACRFVIDKPVVKIKITLK